MAVPRGLSAWKWDVLPLDTQVSLWSKLRVAVSASGSEGFVILHQAWDVDLSLNNWLLNCIVWMGWNHQPDPFWQSATWYHFVRIVDVVDLCARWFRFPLWTSNVEKRLDLHQKGIAGMWSSWCQQSLCRTLASKGGSDVLQGAFLRSQLQRETAGSWHAHENKLIYGTLVACDPMHCFYVLNHKK